MNAVKDIQGKQSFSHGDHVYSCKTLNIKLHCPNICGGHRKHPAPPAHVFLTEILNNEPHFRALTPAIVFNYAQ